jgi:hypothetical protein
MKAGDYFEEAMIHEKKRQEKEEERYQESKAKEEELLCYVKEFKDSSLRKAIQEEKNGLHLADIAASLVGNSKTVIDTSHTTN